MDTKDATYRTEQEATERREAALRRMLSTPHKPHKPIKKKKKTRKKESG
jgi:hypothetical protein